MNPSLLKRWYDFDSSSINPSLLCIFSYFSKNKYLTKIHVEMTCAFIRYLSSINKLKLGIKPTLTSCFRRHPASKAAVLCIPQHDRVSPSITVRRHYRSGFHSWSYCFLARFLNLVLFVERSKFLSISELATYYNEGIRVKGNVSPLRISLSKYP